jgi:hypothetical protein
MDDKEKRAIAATLASGLLAKGPHGTAEANAQYAVTLYDKVLEQLHKHVSSGPASFYGKS